MCMLLQKLCAVRGVSRVKRHVRGAWGLAGISGIKSSKTRLEDRPLLIPALNCLLFQLLTHRCWKARGDKVKRKGNGGVKLSLKKTRKRVRVSRSDMAVYGHES